MNSHGYSAAQIGVHAREGQNVHLGVGPAAGGPPAPIPELASQKGVAPRVAQGWDAAPSIDTPVLSGRPLSVGAQHPLGMAPVAPPAPVQPAASGLPAVTLDGDTMKIGAVVLVGLALFFLPEILHALKD